MNKTILTAIVAAAIAVTAGATASFADQPSTTSPATSTSAAPVHKGGGLKIMKELGLTKDQLKQIKSIRSTEKTKADAIKNDASLSEADKKAKLKTLHKDTRTQMEAVLTPDQLAKLKQLREARREERKNGTAATAE